VRQDEFLYAVAQGLPHTYGDAFYWKASSRFDFVFLPLFATFRLMMGVLKQSPIVQQAFDKDEPYFNAGVAVINFDKWRSQNVTGTASPLSSALCAFPHANSKSR